MGESLNILLIEDSMPDGELVLDTIRDAGHTFEHLIVNNKTAVKQALLDGDWHLILCDYALPGFDPLAVLKLVEESGKDIPFIVITGGIGEDNIIRLMKSGSHDCVMKNDLKRLPRVMARALSDAEVRKENRLMKERMIKYQLLSECAKDAIFFVDRSGRILDVNNAALNLYGYDRETFMTLSVFDIRRTPHTGTVEIQMDQADREGLLFETVHYRKDGTSINVEVSSQGADFNGERVLLSIIRDITERKQIEEVLLFLSQHGYSPEGDDFFHDLAQFIGEKLRVDYVCIDRLIGDNLSAQTLSIYCDGNFEDNVSYELKDTPCGTLMGKRICTFVQNVKGLFPNDEVLQEMAAESYVGTTLFAKNGKPIGLIATISRRPLKSPRIPEMLLEIVSARAAGELERRMVEEELIRERAAAEAATAAKSKFLANMSHEIRTPMNGILGTIQLAMMTDLTEEQQEYLRLAQSSTEALLVLTNDILDYSKMEAGKLDLEDVAFNLQSLIDDLVNLFKPSAHSKGIALKSVVDKSLSGMIHGDPFRLRQVLSNLVGNAVKFTRTGEILLTVSADESIGVDQFKLKFSVTDTGIGISEEKANILFDRFQQGDSSTAREYGGSGLGLAISKKLVELMGGEIAVKSDSSGSCFYFTSLYKGTLVSQAGQENISAMNNSGNGIKDSPAILLVDDDPVSRTIVEKLASKRGWQITQACDGFQALAHIKENEYDVILLDVQMPEMDGYEVTARIREIERGTGKRTTVIAMTAYGLDGQREECLAVGMDDYISKPVIFPEFYQIMERWVGSDKAKQDGRE